MDKVNAKRKSRKSQRPRFSLQVQTTAQNRLVQNRRE